MKNQKDGIVEFKRKQIRGYPVEICGTTKRRVRDIKPDT